MKRMENCCVEIDKQLRRVVDESLMGNCDFFGIKWETDC
jgi:hypothetical protein